MLVNSYCLPYYDSAEKYVSWFDVEGEEHKTDPEKFEDITTDGGRCVGFYTFEIRKVI